jgi:aspartate-semialdehyde dehydrogenase
VDRFRVGILGATGLVGQRLIERLADHPWLSLHALAASERSAGRPFREAARWSISPDPPLPYADWTVRRCDARDLAECDLLLSGLDTAAAREIEHALVAAGKAVVSNSSVHRMDPDVPLLVPEVNASHLDLLDAQVRRTGGGYVVTNPNCTVTGLAMALAPLERAFGVRRVVVSTMQAVSGAGLDGPRALEAIDNVVPFIPGEEEKVEAELPKILGRFDAGALRPAGLVVSAHCHRVPTIDGHLEAVSVELARPATPEEAVEAMRAFRGEAAGLSLPSAPEAPVVVRDEPDRPQPRLDRHTGGGMCAVVGRVRRCPVLTLRFEVLSHNTVRGAAGGTLLNAELLVARQRIPARSPA